MAGSYRECDACGKRALSIANRCPGCGREFPARELPKDDDLDLRRFFTPKGVAAVLAVGVVLISARPARTREPVEAKAEVGYSVASTGQSETPKVAALPVKTVRVATPPATRGNGLRVARSWTEVRRSRSPSAPVEAVLTPGDTVQADSLAEGWYRVALEDEVLGYAHRSTLKAIR